LKSTVAVNQIPEVSQAQGMRSSFATGTRLKLIIDRLQNVCQSLPSFGQKSHKCACSLTGEYL
jgi:hypothetical protein